MIQDALEKIVSRQSLTRSESAAVMEIIMTGKATAAQIGALMAGMRMKGETADEITGFASVMREKATKVHCKSYPIVDTCGTGGDGRNTFNISTVGAFVAAGAGAHIAKHGGSAVSSRSGSADVLKELGVGVEIPPEQIAACVDEIGIGFLFAAHLQKAMGYAAGPRREVGFRAFFNMLGPLTHPAGATRQVMGVYSADVIDLVAEALKNFGTEHAFVFHSDDGLDELTTTAATQVAEIKDGTIRRFKIKPDEIGLPPAGLEDLSGGDTVESAEIVHSILNGETGPRRDIVLLNSGAALVVAGLASDFKHGIELSRSSIDSGAALSKLNALKAATN
jgi:anthranilate phosphoribosyltransferase